MCAQLAEPAPHRPQRAPGPRPGTNCRERGDVGQRENSVPHESALSRVCVGDTPLPPRRKQSRSHWKFSSTKSSVPDQCCCNGRFFKSQEESPGPQLCSVVSGQNSNNTPSPPPPPIINNIFLINTSNSNTTARAAAAGAGVGGRCRRGPPSLRRAAGRERAARLLPPSPRPEGTGGPPRARSAAGRGAWPGGRERAAPSLLCSAPLRMPGGGVGAARSALLRGGARLRGPPARGPRRGARGGGGGESCSPSRCERHQLPYKGLFPAGRRLLPSEAIRRSLPPPSPLPLLAATSLIYHQLRVSLCGRHCPLVLPRGSLSSPAPC